MLWRLALAGFSWYVRDLSRFSIHGSISAVIVFLIWVYLWAVILMYGAEYTVAYSVLRARRPREGMSPDGRGRGGEGDEFFLTSRVATPRSRRT